MKKTVAILLSLMMLFAFTSCGGGSTTADPKTTVIDAYAKTAELTHMDMTASIVMDMGELGSMEIPMSMKAVQENGVMDAAYIETSVIGMDMILTYVDGYMYTDAMGQKVKMAMAPEDFAAQSNTQMFDLGDIETMIESATANGKDEDGNDKYDVVMSTDYFNNMLEQQLGSTVDLESASATYESAACTMSVNKDGYLTAMNMSMSVKMEAEGQSMTMGLNMDMKYNNPGQTFEITAPADAADYMETAM